MMTSSKWKHFSRHWPVVRGIHRSSVNSTHKGQCPGALILTLIWARINGWVNNHEAGDLRRHRAHYDVIVVVKDAFRTEIPYCNMAIMGMISKLWDHISVQESHSPNQRHEYIAFFLRVKYMLVHGSYQCNAFGSSVLNIWLVPWYGVHILP